MPRVTIRDVARAAGVSTTTVSDALSGGGRLSEETRRRVREVAEATGYVASAAARSLRLGRSGALGLYVPNRAVGFEYYGYMARGAAEAAFGHGFALTLVPAWDDPEQLRTLHLDGLIVSDPALDDPVMRTLRGLPVPMVTCERDPDATASPTAVLQSDHTAALVELIGQIRTAGAQRVAVLTPGSETAFGLDIRRACAQNHADLDVIDVPLAYAVEDVNAAMDVVLRQPPEALIAVPDGSALIALQRLRTAGLQVPEDILLASYVDAPSLRTAQPPITAVNLNPRMMGAAAVDAVVEAVLHGTTTSGRSTVPAEVVVRPSTRR